MKWISLLLVLAAGCGKQSYTEFHSLMGRAHSEKVILISCVRCNCIIEDLNKLLEAHNPVLDPYRFMGDSNCLKSFKGRDRLIHIPQAAIDSVSMDIYNMLILNGSQIRMVKTEDSKKMIRYLE